MGVCCCTNHKVEDTILFHKMRVEEEEDPHSDDDDSVFECPICLGTIKTRLQATPCMHVFHDKNFKMFCFKFQDVFKNVLL